MQTTTIDLIQHGLGDATNNSTTPIGACNMEIHTILKPNMIRVGLPTKNNGIIERHDVCHVTKVCSISLIHQNKVLLGHECHSW